MDVPDQPPSHYESSAQVKEQAFRYMQHLTGWCTNMKAGILIDLILKSKPKVVVEIGVYGGKSLVPMGYALQVNGIGKAYGIDPWMTDASLEDVHNASNRYFWSTIDHEAIRLDLVSKLATFNLNNQIELIQTTSAEAEPIQDIDLLHIDGNHSEKTSFLDVIKWVPLVKSGGWIILDDMTWYEEGVYTEAKAVAWLDQHCRKFAEFKDDSVWGIWVKP
jgi:predicted O-methyltransferase YrrM